MIFSGGCNVDGIYDFIKEEVNKKEVSYVFPSMEKTEHSIYDSKKINVFSMYNNTTYLLFKNVIEVIKLACKGLNLSYEKNKYFISSELIENIDTEYWYDAGGTSKPCLFGLINIDITPLSVSIDNNDISANPGDILVAEAGKKIVYKESKNIIMFHVAPLSMIKKQYPQKWIPLV